MSRTFFDANTSYLFGDDRLSGWGPRYFFTFYTELGERKLPAILECSLYGLIFVPSVLANLAIAAAVLLYAEMRTVTNLFLLNLTMADLIFVSGVPALLYARLTTEWKLGQNLCKLLPYSQFVCGFVLLWTLTWISMDRYRCIVIPPFRSRLTPQRATLLTFVTWLVGMLIFLPVAFWFRVQKVQNDSIEICTLVFPRNDVISLSLTFTVPTLLLSCLTPLSLFVYHYQRIFRQIGKLRKRWKTTASFNNNAGISSLSREQQQSRQHRIVDNSSSNNNNTNNDSRSSQQEKIRFNRHLKIVHIFLANVLAVLIMWLPITAIMLLIYLDGRRPNEDTNFFLRSHHFVLALQIALLNTIVNPLLYGVLSENFRNCFLRMWSLSRKRRALNRFVYNNDEFDGRNASGKSCTVTRLAIPITGSASIAEC